MAKHKHVYDELAKVLESVVSSGKRTDILMCALHCFQESRSPEKDISRSTNQAIKRYDAAYERCVKSSTCDVRDIHIFGNEERLDEIVKWIRKIGDVERYTVRAFAFQEAPPYLSPFIIGEEDVFLGIESPTHYRMDYAIHFKGNEIVRIMKGYFDTLWEAKGHHQIKSPRRIKEQNINALREEIGKRKSPTTAITPSTE